MTRIIGTIVIYGLAVYGAIELFGHIRWISEEEEEEKAT